MSTISKTPIPTGLIIPSQIPLNNKEYFLNETDLANLGVDNNLAFSYYKGMPAYCAKEGTKWIWKEITIETNLLLPDNFIYPDGWEAEGIDYSNKEYNFVKDEIPEGILPPLERLDQGNGEGIIIRGRDSNNYLTVGNRAIDLSYSGNSFPLSGASGTGSFTANSKTIATGEDSTAFNSSQALEQGSFAMNEGKVTGFYACAWGSGEAKGQYSMAGGVFCESNNQGSTATGTSTKALGFSTDAIGQESEALGPISNVTGHLTKARGNVSTAVGQNNETDSHGEMAIGVYGTIQSGNPSAIEFIPTDRLFNIGNGFINPLTSIITRSNALTILKNGLATLPSITISLIDNSSGKTIVTKEYLDYRLATPVSNQKIINYPDDFTLNNYNLTSVDNNKLIIVNNGSNNVTITVPIGLPVEFFAGFIRKGSGEIAFEESSTTINTSIGKRIDLQFDQVALDKEGNTTTFYLTGNTKV